MTPHRATPTPQGLAAPGGFGAGAVIAVPSRALRTRLRTAAAPAHAPLARGCRPRGCRAPARRVHGRRVRYVIGDEPGQVNGMRWRGRFAPAFT